MSAMRKRRQQRRYLPVHLVAIVAATDQHLERVAAAVAAVGQTAIAVLAAVAIDHQAAVMAAAAAATGQAVGIGQPKLRAGCLVGQTKA